MKRNKEYVFECIDYISGEVINSNEKRAFIDILRDRVNDYRAKRVTCRETLDNEFEIRLKKNAKLELYF